MTAGKIGLFGGTFNPIHNGHLQAAEEVMEIAGLDEVIFIPSHTPPHRLLDGNISGIDRLRMVEAAVEGRDGLCVSDYEVHREQVSYTYDTLQHFLASRPDAHLGFLIGTDAFAEFDTWYKADQVLGLCDFLVMDRPGSRMSAAKALPEKFRRHYKQIDENRLVHESGGEVRLIKIRGIEVSSTQIRRYLKNGQNVDDLLPAKTLAYIRKQGLYV